MKNFFKKRRELVAIAVFACVCGAIAYFVIRPILAEINQRRDQIQEEIATQEDRKKQIAALPSIKEQYLSVQNKGDAINVLLDKDSAVTLIEQVEQLAKSTNNDVKITISQNDPNSREAIIAQKAAAQDKNSNGKSASIADALPSKNYLEMNIALTGKYNDVVNFIEKLENMKYYSDTISFDMKQDDSTKNSAGSSSGISNPFTGQNQSAAKEPAVLVSSGQKLAAMLDVVFYLKQ
jgi:Tfp pilus assembly protein PilO